MWLDGLEILGTLLFLPQHPLLENIPKFEYLLDDLVDMDEKICLEYFVRAVYVGVFVQRDICSRGYFPR